MDPESPICVSHLLASPKRKRASLLQLLGKKKKKVSSWAHIGHTWVSVFCWTNRCSQRDTTPWLARSGPHAYFCTGESPPPPPAPNYTDSRVKEWLPTSHQGIAVTKRKNTYWSSTNNRNLLHSTENWKKSQRSTQKKIKARHYTTLIRDLNRPSGFSFHTQGNSVTLRTCSKPAAWPWFKQECEKEKKSKGIFAETLGLATHGSLNLPLTGSHQIPTKLRTNLCLLEYLRSPIHPLPIHPSTYPSIHPSTLPPADPISSKVRLPGPGTWFKSRSQEFPAGWLWSSSPIHAPVCSFVKRGH